VTTATEKSPEKEESTDTSNSGKTQFAIAKFDYDPQKVINQSKP
jgi:hypothetical protein